MKVPKIKLQSHPHENLCKIIKSKEFILFNYKTFFNLSSPSHHTYIFTNFPLKSTYNFSYFSFNSNNLIFIFKSIPSNLSLNANTTLIISSYCNNFYTIIELDNNNEK